MSTAGIGGLLARRRRSLGLSQLDLALRLNVSQRHLGFVETGRAGASKDLLVVWMSELGFEPSETNAALVRSGFQAADLDRAAAPAGPLHDLERVLEAHEPHPAFVFDAAWQMVRINSGARRLCALLMPGFWREAGEPLTGVDMIEAMMAPDGFFSQMSNAGAVAAALLRQLRVEEMLHPDMSERIDRLEARLRRDLDLGDATLARQQSGRSLELVFESAHGRLNFVTAQFMAGLPQDAGPTSLRMEVWFPADQATKSVMTALARQGARNEPEDP